MRQRQSVRVARTPKQYWWIGCTDNSRQTLIFGSDKSEEDARQKGLEMLPGTNFTIKRLPTRDLATASSMWKGLRLEQTHNLHKSLKHLTHEKGLLRKRRKQYDARSY